MRPMAILLTSCDLTFLTPVNPVQRSLVLRFNAQQDNFTYWSASAKATMNKMRVWDPVLDENVPSSVPSHPVELSKPIAPSCELRLMSMCRISRARRFFRSFASLTLRTPRLGGISPAKYQSSYTSSIRRIKLSERWPCTAPEPERNILVGQCRTTSLSGRRWLRSWLWLTLPLTRNFSSRGLWKNFRDEMCSQFSAVLYAQLRRDDLP